MADEPAPSALPIAPQPWFERLGLSGKLLAAGALMGIVAAFLPYASQSVEMGGAGPMAGFPGMEGGPMMKMSGTANVVAAWQGKLGLIGYVAAFILAFVLYPPGGLVQKSLGWAAVAIGVMVAVLAAWLLLAALDTANADLMGMANMDASIGIGAFLNVLAGAAVAAGGFLKAKEERLI